MGAALAMMLALCPVLAIGQPAALERQPSRDGPPSARYTIVEKGEALELPDDTPRVAVLIGNGEYQKAPPNADPLKARLPPLETPCSDVKAVADRLVDLGWARSEVYVLCEQSNLNTFAAINTLRASAPIDGKTKRLMVLYLAGHGMEVDGSNYFFGVSARLDLETVARRLIGKLENTSKGEPPEPLLAVRDAVDIDAIFNDYRNQANLPYALLIFVDACRNNPLLGYVDQEADARKDDPATSDTERNYWSLLRRFMSRTKATADWPRGLEMVYATRPNNTIVDNSGSGGSRLATSLVGKLTADTAIRIILGDVADDMKRGQSNPAAPDYQDLDSISDVSSDMRNEWCMIGCKLPGGGPVGSAGASVVLPAGLRRAAFRRASAPTPARGPIASPSFAAQTSSVSDGDRPQTVVRASIRYKATAPRKVLVRIAWCSGDILGAARYIDAQHAYDALVANLSKANRIHGSSQIYGVQLIEIPPETNRLATFQRRSDAEYVDPIGTDRDENMLASQYLGSIKGKLPVRGTDFPTPNVIDLSYCRGAFTGQPAPSVYLQVLSRNDLPAAARLWTILDEKSPDLRVLPKAEVMSEKPGWSLTGYPAETEIRISDPNNRTRADQLATLLTAAVGRPVPVRCINACRDPKPEHNIEVWIGSALKSKDDLKAAIVPFSSIMKF